MGISLIKQWIITLTQAKVSDFDPFQFAFRLALVMTLLVNVLCFGLHALLDYFSLLPYSFWPAVFVGASISTVITGPLTFYATYINGLAIQELIISHDEFAHLSRTDMLSGLLNRRAFTEAFESISGPVSIVIFDIDRFKSINDNHGHMAGDLTIAAVAEELSEAFRGSHVVARIGGEEFAAILRCRTAEERSNLVEQARRRVESRDIHVAGNRISVTISAGVAERGDNANLSELLNRADKALYVAKTKGRNRVIFFSEVGGKTWHDEREENRDGDARRRDLAL